MASFGAKRKPRKIEVDEDEDEDANAVLNSTKTSGTSMFSKWIFMFGADSDNLADYICRSIRQAINYGA